MSRLEECHRPDIELPVLTHISPSFPSGVPPISPQWFATLIEKRAALRHALPSRRAESRQLKKAYGLTEASLGQVTGTGDMPVVSKGFMEWCSARSPWRVSAVVLTLLLPTATRSAAFQAPVQQSEQGSANELKLTAAEENDSYEIYSMLLRTEMPPQWNIRAWAIRQETHAYPNYGGSLGVCLQPSQDQKSIYEPLIEDYIAKNNEKKLVLKRKFDLSQYALIGPTEIKAIQERPRASAFPFSTSVIFQVSAVGFNRDGTRALVYVGHDCGSLCGGGGYHLLVKKNGQWQVDREYRGLTCVWAA